MYRQAEEKRRRRMRARRDRASDEGARQMAKRRKSLWMVALESEEDGKETKTTADIGQQLSPAQRVAGGT